MGCSFLCAAGKFKKKNIKNRFNTLKGQIIKKLTVNLDKDLFRFFKLIVVYRFACVNTFIVFSRVTNV